MKVKIEHDGYNWIAIPECGGTTSAKRVGVLLDRTLEVIELMTGSTVTRDDLELDVRIDGPGAELAREARAARVLATTALAHSTELTEAAVTALRRQGWSMRDIGELVGVSYQRVHQLSGADSR